MTERFAPRHGNPSLTWIKRMVKAKSNQSNHAIATVPMACLFASVFVGCQAMNKPFVISGVSGESLTQWVADAPDATDLTTQSIDPTTQFTDPAGNETTRTFAGDIAPPASTVAFRQPTTGDAPPVGQQTQDSVVRAQSGDPAYPTTGGQAVGVGGQAGGSSVPSLQSPGYQPPDYQVPAYQPPPGTPANGTSVGNPQTSAPQKQLGYGDVPAGSYTAPQTGYAAPQGQYNGYGYESAVAPGATISPYASQSAIAPGALPTPGPDFEGIDITAPDMGGYQPQERIAPIDVYVQEARTGRVILGGAVNSDLGVSGQLIIEERNFDIRRMPRSMADVWSGRAFRGGGQNFRAELMPGSQVQRYTVSWTDPHFRDLPYSLSIGGFLFTRQFRDWTEQRLGGRVALGYEITKDLSISSELRMEDVKLFDPRVGGVDELDQALGSTDLYRGRFRLAHDTRDNPFMSTQGGLTEVIFDQVFGEYDYQRAQFNLSRYFLMRERADGGGRHTLASTWRVGVTGSQTPIFENFFAGGYSTMRGFSFRGASPVVGDVQVGGELMFLGSLEYVFPLTADEMLRGIVFVDYGTVERDLEINAENFRVAPGFGFRIAVPALGPAPLAFDFAFPVNSADTDDRQVFSFFMGLTRS